MNDKPPLDFLIHNLESLLECIHEHYGVDATRLIRLEKYEEEEDECCGRFCDVPDSPLCTCSNEVEEE